MHNLIETAPTPRPRCRYCDEALRPKYVSIYQRASDPHGTRVTEEQADALREAGFTITVNPRVHPSYKNHLAPDPTIPGERRLVLREFDGRYGFRDLFCNRTCATEYGVATARRLS